MLHGPKLNYERDIMSYLQNPSFIKRSLKTSRFQKRSYNSKIKNKFQYSEMRELRSLHECMRRSDRIKMLFHTLRYKSNTLMSAKSSN